MRIAIAELKQETNTFVPFTTTVKTFEDQYLYRGDELLTAFGKARLEVPGALNAIKEAGAQAVPLLATMAMASGVVERKSFDILMGEIEQRLKAAVPIDGVFLALHGAMILEDEPDAEAEIVRRVRAVVGVGVPITVSLDLHGHITKAMLQPDVAYIGYREFPHIDMYETGYRATRLLIDWIKGEVNTVLALSKRHMIFSPDSARTTVPPLADIVAEGRAMEARGEVLHVSLFPVQPWIDSPDLGFAALVCAESEEAAQTATGKVKVISDGSYILEGPGGNGMAGEMGLTVVLAIGAIRLNLRSIPHFEWDVGIHKSVGLDPARAALVFVRSPSHFRVSYAPIAARIFLADTPGPTCVNMRRIPYTKVTRPLYPLDLVNE